MADHHGIPEEQVTATLVQLDITEHTPEDCRVSETLHAASGKPVVVEGSTAWVLDDDTTVAEGPWVRYRIEAGTRRRILACNTGEVTLLAWSDA
jgi:hypothetical protein